MAPPDRRSALLTFSVAVVLVFCLLCDVSLIRATAPNSDSVANYNQLDAIFSGNILLGRWFVPSDNYYFTDLPFFAFLALVSGRPVDLIYVAPALVYALLLLVSLKLVWRGSAPRRCVSALILLGLIGIPFAPGQDMLRIAGFHTATVLFSLVAVAAIAPVLEDRRASFWRWAVFTSAVLIVCASDPMSMAFFVVPFLGFLVLDVVKQNRLPRSYLYLISVTIVSVFAAAQFPVMAARFGGFQTTSSFSPNMSLDPHDVVYNLKAEMAALAVLFGVTDLGSLPLAGVVSMLRAAAGCWVAVSLAVLMSRTGSAPRLGLARLFALAAIALLAADALSITFTAAVTPGPGFPNAAVRYVAPAFLFLCIAAALAPAMPPKTWILRPLAAGAAVVSTVMVFIAAAALSLQQVQLAPGLHEPAAYQVMLWLRAHRLTYGVGDYYTTQLVRALSNGRVMTDPVLVDRGRLAPVRLWTDTARFDAGARPQFVIFPEKNWFGLTAADAVATYGVPLRTTWVGGVRVMLYTPAPPEH